MAQNMQKSGLVLGNTRAMSADILPSIQILRAIAALLVVVTHCYAPFELGRVGVDIFFVISGFIMVYKNERAFGRPGASLAFIRNRLAKIAPTYWLCTVFTMIVIVGSGSPLSLLWLSSSLAFIPSTGSNGSILPILPTGWTLNFEMFFYLIFSACLILPKRVGLMAMFAVLATLVGLGVAFAPQSPFLVYWTHPLLLEFAMGMAIALIRPHLAIGRVSGLLLAALGFAIVAAFWNYAVPDRLADKWLALSWGAPSALIVAGLAFSDRGLAFPRLLVPAIFLGNASYSIYLAHLAIIIWAGTHAAWLIGFGPLALIGAGIFGGIALHIAVERPFDRFFKRRRSIAMAAAARY